MWARSIVCVNAELVSESMHAVVTCSRADEPKCRRLETAGTEEQSLFWCPTQEQDSGLQTKLNRTEQNKPEQD